MFMLEFTFYNAKYGKFFIYIICVCTDIDIAKPPPCLCAHFSKFPCLVSVSVSVLHR